MNTQVAANYNKLRNFYKSGNYPAYAEQCLKIRTKDPNAPIQPLKLNTAQKYIHEQLEDQKKRTGKIRALILKGRQQGCSTYVEGRFIYNVTFNVGVRAYILTHLDEATANLFAMVKRYYDHLPEFLKPDVSTANTKELYFKGIESGYKVGTAKSKGSGRSDTLQYFHGSEVAYWANAGDHMEGAVQAVPDMPGTEIILESTSDGAQGLFYEMCKEAQAGSGDYELIFVPWFVQDEYRAKLKAGFERTDEESELVNTYELDDEQLQWRRNKIHELRSVWMFKRVYPCCVDDAFNSSVPGALWDEQTIENCRIHKLPEHVQLVRIVIGADPATTSKDSSDEHGIIGGALGNDGNMYVFKDASGKFHVEKLFKILVSLYHEFDADLIVAEKNQGGDMVELGVRAAEKSPEILERFNSRVNTVAYKGVHASKGKRARAEPIAMMYANGRVKHLGELTGLEQQMMSWNAKDGSPSPDRVDALVWVGTELMMGTGKTASVIIAG